MPESVRTSFNILVVEDDLPTLELIEEVLTSVDAKVIGVSDSPSAWGLFDKVVFDGIFLDLQMPKMDGFQLAERIRESRCNQSTPIVVVTGREDKQTMQQAFAAGATLFLQKPVDRAKLLTLFRATSAAMAENRLRRARVAVCVEVTCQCGHQDIKGSTVNLRDSGVLVQLERPIESGTVIRMSFRLPGEERPITVEGRVVRTDENGCVAVRFTKFVASGQQLLRDFLRKQSQDQQ